MDKQQIKEVMAYLGRKKSEKKAEASRKNGLLGGKPRSKKQPLTIGRVSLNYRSGNCESESERPSNMRRERCSA
jgi:hypothetical protein